MSDHEFITATAIFLCGHSCQINTTIDSAGVDVAMALSELCKECDNKVTELKIEEEYKKSLCRNHEECSKETMCNGQSLISGDDKHYCFKRQLIEETDPYYCSRMNAFCPKAPTCYGEHIEHDDSTCSNGMVLCTAADDELDRAMYSIEALEEIGLHENDEIPF